ncbi:HAMP domain-containing histidine kinase [Idiomarina xiamenensis]|uniref:histidine kinase n=1 Tax=Idiomarina xiamenensis 10-D-4 TaxID=740709 RepID=K2JZB7_9GAMM|nr:HAMP domain-containing histidine kinase [Idiomarina xiamenensis]EKE79947.1 sensor signal transduction histidine kinase [Idiomarina xiamenensis 10-D-4]
MLLLLLLAWRRSIRLPHWLASLVLIAEVLALNSLIALHGAASNPFSAILLVPVVLAFMLLPLAHASSILLVSVAAQSIQLALLPEHTLHGPHGAAMLSHFRAMVLSFVLTSGLIAVVIRYFRYQVFKREQAIATMRERQLRDEQLLAMGTAAAQLTHDVATPTQALQLLIEEAREQHPQADWLMPIEQQTQRITNHLQSWRRIADDVRERRQRHYALTELWPALQQALSLARPEANIAWQASIDQSSDAGLGVRADATLLPALTSVIINACDALYDGEYETTETPHQLAQVNVTLQPHAQQLWLRVENPLTSADVQQQTRLQQLGQRMLTSEHGFGMGAVLSNATIERFGGQVNWQQLMNDRPMLLTTVCLPLVPHQPVARSNT